MGNIPKHSFKASAKWIISLVILGLLSCPASTCIAQDKQSTESKWVDLFNGKDLNGWTVKIAGHPIGDNYANTFRVEDGILKCEYDDYNEFDGRYGHLYTNLSYSHYKLRMEYRFEGRQLPDAPNYVDLNSGVMLHSQSPQSMKLEQAFPASLEMQFLAD